VGSDDGVNLLIYAAFPGRGTRCLMTDPEVTNKNMTSAEFRVVSTVSIIGMLRMIGLFALLPVMAEFAGSLAMGDSLLVGLAVGGYGLTQALLQIPIGAVSDRIGRVPVILFGLALFAAGSLLAAFADNIYIVIVGRLLQGGGAISAALAAMIADATRDEVRTRSMAVYGAGVGLAFLLAMVLGPVIASYFGVRSLFVVAAAMAIAAGVLLVSIPSHMRPQTHALRWRFQDAFYPSLLRIDLYVFILHCVLTATFVALPFVITHRLELPSTEQWPLYVGALLLSLVGTVPLIFKDEHRGQRATITIAVMLLIAGQLLFAFASVSFWSVFAALTLFFAGFNFLEAALPARVTTVATEDTRGAALGVFSSSQFMGAFVGGLLGGLLIGAGQPVNVFLFCVIVLAIWLAVQSWNPREKSVTA